MNGTGCGINLAFALGHAAEIEAITQRDGEKEEWRGAVDGAVAPGDKPVLLPTLLLLKPFAFAFCLGQTMRKLGHPLVHRACGVTAVCRVLPRVSLLRSDRFGRRFGVVAGAWSRLWGSWVGSRLCSWRVWTWRSFCFR